MEIYAGKLRGYPGEFWQAVDFHLQSMTAHADLEAPAPTWALEKIRENKLRRLRVPGEV
ncbi:hypothetical protein GCM10023213_47930 [Prosthecobacter algae]|uniref:Uncharacterized protein n=1 Tax=Prosthecobacter algae TaxID=1144682 RepID=A0ABP9PNZ5_9BACT